MPLEISVDESSFDHKLQSGTVTVTFGRFTRVYKNLCLAPDQVEKTIAEIIRDRDEFYAGLESRDEQSGVVSKLSESLVFAFTAADKNPPEVK